MRRVVYPVLPPCPCSGVNRPNQDFRGFAGMISSGLRQGRREDQEVLPSAKESITVTRIVTDEGDLQQAVAGQFVTLTLCH